jgi:sugar transferase (PEP-CTERM/EpsH1 system associated)
MNILVVCRELPYPLNTGYKIRTFNLIKRLSKNNSISIICFDTGNIPSEDILSMQRYCETIKIVTPIKYSKIKQIPNILKLIIAGEPLSIKYAQSEIMKSEIYKTLESRAIDLIHFDDPYMTKNYDFKNRGFIKTSVTYHDIDSHKFKGIFSLERNILRKILLLVDVILLKKWQQDLGKKVDMSIVMSESDANILNKDKTVSNIAVIPNGVDIEEFLFTKANSQNITISYFGNMEYFPNQDAVLFFSKQILPMIKQKIPGVKFLIVGKNPSLTVQSLATDENIIVTGTVDSVIPHYINSSICIVPLRAGGGTRLKILEAMAVGRPVVSTTIGCEGLDVVDGENLLIADTPVQFAEKVIQLINDKQLYQKIANNGRKLVEDKYSWDKIAEKLLAVYAEIVSKPKSILSTVRGD